jgi:hypothetical protein
MEACVSPKVSQNKLRGPRLKISQNGSITALRKKIAYTDQDYASQIKFTEK